MPLRRAFLPFSPSHNGTALPVRSPPRNRNADPVARTGSGVWRQEVLFIGPPKLIIHESQIHEVLVERMTPSTLKVYESAPQPDRNGIGAVVRAEFL